jgi:hypothetical protein
MTLSVVAGVVARTNARHVKVRQPRVNHVKLYQFSSTFMAPRAWPSVQMVRMQV